MTRLRPFQLTDLGALYRVDQVCFSSGIAYSKGELRYYLQHSNSFTLVAETASGVIAGFCTGQPHQDEGNPAGHIITIDVLPEARRQGTGRLLLQAIEEHFRCRGAVSMRLEVAVDNLAAQAFYRSMGYAQLGRIPGYYNGKLDALVLGKAFSGNQ